MSERRVLLELNAEQLAAMPLGDLADIIEDVKRRYPGAKFSGTAVVKRADGTIKYDTPPTPDE